MRAGKLDRSISIQAYDPGTPDDYGTVTPGWGAARTLRAQVVQASTEEFLRPSGEASEEAIVFRTHFLSGIATGDRIGYDGRYFDLDEIKEIGRREGLELRCREVKA